MTYRMKLAARLSALYAALLGVTVVIVILASSIALVFELWGFSRDVTVAKHEEARILVDQYHREGMTLKQAAPDIVNALSGIGMRVTVFDLKGHYLAGDKTLHPRVLSRSAGGRRNAAFHPVVVARASGARTYSSADRRCHPIGRASSRSPSPMSKAAMSASSRPFRCCSFR